MTKRLFLVVAVVLALALAGRTLGTDLASAASVAGQDGLRGALIFGAAYALATVLFVPGSLLTLAAGAIFGVARGVAIVFPAAIVGSTLAFLAARHLVRPLVEARIAGDHRFTAIDQTIAREGRVIVFLLRLSPLMPYNLLNYALGLTRVRTRDYVLAGVGMLPGTVLYVYSGRVAGDLVAILGGAEIQRDAAHYLLLLIGLLATAVVTVRITTIARRALARRGAETAADAA